MGRIDVDLSQASDALRTELIFLADDGSVTRFDGGFVILTPSNPGYWWGNCLRFDRPPRDQDLEHWTHAFEKHVHAVQPASTHMTFGWDGDKQGGIDRFVTAGFEYFETIALTLDKGEAVGAPHPNTHAGVLPISVDDWTSLLALHVEARDPKHSEADYAEFISRKIENWQTLATRGQGCWFGVRDDGRIIAALGVFAEQHRASDGRRIGRFQHVVTHPSWRRKGLAGTLVDHASHYAFEHLDVDRLLIAADENDIARRIYEACGYRIRSRHRGLERGS